MKRKPFFVSGVGLAWLASLVLAVPVAAQTPAVGKTPNGGPNQPQNPSPRNPRLDVGKGRIEMPTEDILAALRTTEAAAKANPSFVNPKVEPGKVKWHPDFATACKAAEKSGKPVLLFQMMGKLDDQFC
jgi:hypothetical protein